MADVREDIDLLNAKLNPRMEVRLDVKKRSIMLELNKINIRSVTQTVQKFKTCKELGEQIIEEVKNINAINTQKKNKYGYVKIILKKSDKKLKQIFPDEEVRLNFIEQALKIHPHNTQKVIYDFSNLYNALVKKMYQQQLPYDKKLINFLNDHQNKIKIVWGNSLNVLKKLPSESIHLMVTSPPYYNARSYSQWNNLKEYLADMKKIIKECYRVIDNNRVFVFNVGDIFDNDNLKIRSTWGKRRLPLGAYFMNIFEECGFTFVDDFIWDKGEVQSQRHKNSSRPYPFYQYPVNCYEHIFVFHKHRLDKTPYPCPVCGCLQVSGNSQSEINLMSWECKNNDCFTRSVCNRGKRFSLKTNTAQNPILREQNVLNEKLINKWRRDVIKMKPVYKINCKGENTLGHTAPFPKDIPEMAVNFFTFKGDLVMDPFAGSFTVPIMAQQLDRIGIGIELRKDLFEKSIKRNIKNNNIQYESTQV